MFDCFECFDKWLLKTFSNFDCFDSYWKHFQIFLDFMGFTICNDLSEQILSKFGLIWILNDKFYWYENLIQIIWFRLYYPDIQSIQNYPSLVIKMKRFLIVLVLSIEVKKYIPPWRLLGRTRLLLILFLALLLWPTRRM